MAAEPTGAIKIFYCYARKDKAGRDRLENCLEPLRRSGQIITWQDREILPGMKWEDEIDTHLNTSEIVLLLVSPDFMHSEYCYTMEMRRALEGEAHVIPIILRPVAWKETPIGELQVLPSEGKPITTWRNRDEAFEDVATGIRVVVKTLLAGKAKEEQARTTGAAVVPNQSSQPPNTVAPSSQSLQSTIVAVWSHTPLISPLSTQEPILTGELQPPKWHISRRAVVGSLTGLAAAGGGMTWLLRSQRPQVSSPPSPSPIGTTLYTYSDRVIPSEVRALTWSPNSVRIASGGDDNTVQVWDATTGGSLFTYLGHSGNITDVKWSPDGTRIASSDTVHDNTVQVWDATTGGNVLTYRGHIGNVLAIAWSPNGKSLVSVGVDKTAQVWDTETGKRILTYHGHSGFVDAVAWSPDGTRIASAGGDTTVQVWDAITGNYLLTYRGHSDYVTDLTWSPDGVRVASGSADTTVQVWDATTGGSVLTYRGHSSMVFAVSWLPHGQRIASGGGDWRKKNSDTTVQVWDAGTGNPTFTYKGHSDVVWTVAWSPNGKLIASGSLDETARVWQAV